MVAILTGRGLALCRAVVGRSEARMDVVVDHTDVPHEGDQPAPLASSTRRNSRRTTMTDDELREFFEQNMAELSPKLHDLREELARVSELLDEARATDTLDPRFAGVSNLVVGLMDVDIRTLQLVDALVRHTLA